MATREIERERWSSELDRFSTGHAGWTVTLEVLGDQLGEQPEANGMPLTGIAVDRKRRPESIAIMVGGRPDRHVTHFVERPSRVWLREPELVGQEAIEVESEDGIRTLVYFDLVPPERQLPG